MTPICYALFDPRTGKVLPTIYQNADRAKVAAVNRSNSWGTFVAVPLFLYPTDEMEENV